jgi:Tfp pilus assembly protein FimT
MTLVELILVMAVLATVIAVSAPSFSRFMGGRTLNEEGRRMLGLMHYGQGQAASCGAPMELWFSPESGRYGLGPQGGYQAETWEPVEYELAEDLAFEVEQDTLDAEGVGRIVFLPEGAIGPDSPESLIIFNDKDESIQIARADYGNGYRIQSEEE